MRQVEDGSPGLDKARHLEMETRETDSLDGWTPPEVSVPALTLLAHPDARRVGEVATFPELPAGREVRLSRLEPDFAAPGSARLEPLADPHLSRRPILIRPGAETGTLLVERAGSSTRVEIDGEPLPDAHPLPAEDLERGVVLYVGKRIALVLHLHPPTELEVPSYGLIGESLPMLRLRRQIRLIADLDTPVLLRGASGTGKELIARALHTHGVRQDKPYVVVNMAAVPPTLAAAELFGAQRGAYTGADRKKEGYFRRAHGGTLFLDEIGETPQDVQPLLLRALESGEIQPVGSVDKEHVDARVIAATDADLETLIHEGRFRAPLLHRLAGYEIRVPPLRERRDDIGRLLYAFLREELAKLGEEGVLDVETHHSSAERPWPPAALVARLARGDWPGNVRQLRNAARRLTFERRAGGLDTDPAWLDSLHDTEPARPPAASASNARADDSSASRPEGWRPVYRKASEVSEDELRAALRCHRYELRQTAQTLGVSRGALYDLIDACPKIRKASELERGEIARALDRSRGDLTAAAIALEVSLYGFKRRAKALGLI